MPDCRAPLNCWTQQHNRAGHVKLQASRRIVSSSNNNTSTEKATWIFIINLPPTHMGQGLLDVTGMEELL